MYHFSCLWLTGGVTSDFVAEPENCPLNDHKKPIKTLLAFSWNVACTLPWHAPSMSRAWLSRPTGGQPGRDPRGAKEQWASAFRRQNAARQSPWKSFTLAEKHTPKKRGSEKLLTVLLKSTPLILMAWTVLETKAADAMRLEREGKQLSQLNQFSVISLRSNVLKISCKAIQDPEHLEHHQSWQIG